MCSGNRFPSDSDSKIDAQQAQNYWRRCRDETCVNGKSDKSASGSDEDDVCEVVQRVYAHNATCRCRNCDACMPPGTVSYNGVFCSRICKTSWLLSDQRRRTRRGDAGHAGHAGLPIPRGEK